ncbi:HamA C-terminal domain-containing protein [Halocatena pleomorpha]|uniref:DUF1837 domain-containing protein n=1 Tax=Halocatena pleomorpha TaxID=1785090 RepID=A0A3P3R3Q1_9EURY|nr:DUF1837 domain-containing protein [Halocatena pleomorpha]RRJ28096.1 DUF1837 domain-containing protein [Halocatena pleomorpha]
MEKEFDDPWAEHTVIDGEELADYLQEGSQWQDKKIRVDSYIIKPNHGILDYTSFIQYLGRKYPYFAFSEDEVKEFDRPMHRAQKLSDYKDDARYDGKWGELILFLLVDGVLDIPMVSHKLGWKQNPVDQIKGSDGLFFGEFEGNPSLAIGEAKMYGNLSGGVEEALDSTDRFHGSGSQTRNQHELAVAAGNISKNLSPEKIERLASLFTSQERDYQIIHPIFVGYDDPDLGELQTEPLSDRELIERVREHITETDLVSIVERKLEDEYSHLRKHRLVFFFLPLENKNQFSENMKEEIYPHSTNH